ncbi:shikimate dehydrogenase family protein [Jannaschia ovalis]|uniref:Shikimate dehydrogenase n=1 Tax=Jannaschia ovalis TaxID=3038773 RepID=A0ABY8LFL9_9RHOB|nr:shikimate dehydrogenase [Jannaschia sp. GRR-S6-38]WGH78905.1 shikimate dehydrogenase [Jannaschia sp. GRR-S6-38]
MILRCGLIGENIGASRLHRALDLMGAAHGVEVAFTAIDTAGDPDFDFDATVDELRLLGWTGVTVTHPWKTHAAAWAGSAMVPGCERLGAANTLTFAPPAGHNTDYTGFLAAWDHEMAGRAPGAVAVAGAGGVARAVLPALIARGADPMTVWDLDRAAALALAAATGATAVDPRDAADAIRAADGLVNCTPLGMAAHPGSAFPAEAIGPQGWAFDAVYTPTETAFLRDARKAGLAILTGFDLFRHMAIRSFAAYTGITPDPAPTLAALAALRPD